MPDQIFKKIKIKNKKIAWNSSSMQKNFLCNHPIPSLGSPVVAFLEPNSGISCKKKKKKKIYKCDRPILGSGRPIVTF